MSRAQGKHTPRKPVVEEVDPESPLGRQLGMSPRVQGTPSPIPGGRNHISNAPTGRQQAPIPEAGPEIDYFNAHGVPVGTATTRERAELERGPNTTHAHDVAPHLEGPAEKPVPVPVYVVEDDRQHVYRTAAPHAITVPVNTADPVRLCGRDRSRRSIQLLNESSSTNVRFAQRLSDLSNGGGALLPAPTSSYLKIDTQDELWALSASGTAATVSIIQVYERGM